MTLFQSQDLQENLEQLKKFKKSSKKTRTIEILSLYLSINLKREK
jgi:hypothetical protein